MKKTIKRFLVISVAIFFLLATTTFIASKSIQPSVKFSPNNTTISQQEWDALQTTLMLRLTKEAVAAVTNNSSQATLYISEDELDKLLLAQVMSTNTPSEISFTGSKFTIDKSIGNLEVGVRLKDFLTIGATASFTTSFQNSYLIFHVEELKVGRFILSAKVTHWLLEQLNQQHQRNLTDNGLFVYPEKKEVHFPVDFNDEILTLSNIYFAEPNGTRALAIDFLIDYQKIQNQIIEEIKKSGNDLVPWILEAAGLL